MLGPSFAGFNWFDFHIRWIQHVVAFFCIFKVVFAVTFFAAGQVEALCIRISSLAYLGTTSPIDSWRFWMPEHKVMSTLSWIAGQEL